jgi:hypothetical protein
VRSHQPVEIHCAVYTVQESDPVRASPQTFGGPAQSITLKILKSELLGMVKSSGLRLGARVVDSYDSTVLCIFYFILFFH